MASGTPHFGQVSDKSNQGEKSLRLFVSIELQMYIFQMANGNNLS